MIGHLEYKYTLLKLLLGPYIKTELKLHHSRTAVTFLDKFPVSRQPEAVYHLSLYILSIHNPLQYGVVLSQGIYTY